MVARPVLPASPQQPQARRAPIPNLLLDPLASLRPAPVVLEVAGEQFEIPALVAADWLEYLMPHPPNMEGLLTDHLPGVEDLVYAGRLSLDDMYAACLGVIEVASGRRWWVAMRLIGVVYDSMHLLGPILARRLDVDRVSLSCWLDTVLAVVMENLAVEETTMFALQLEALPPEAVTASVESAPAPFEMSREAFLAMGR